MSVCSDQVRAKESKSGMDVVISEGGGRGVFFYICYFLSIFFLYSLGRGVFLLMYICYFLSIFFLYLYLLGGGGGREKRQQLQGG